VIAAFTVLAALEAILFALHQDGSWRSISLGVCVAATSAKAFLGWSRTREGPLVWDGQAWLGPEQVVLHVRVIFDFQQLMLVRTSDHFGKSGWLWLERSTDSAHWLRLRRALVSSQK
jgi:hypothetical protein